MLALPCSALLGDRAWLLVPPLGAEGCQEVADRTAPLAVAGAQEGVLGPPKCSRSLAQLPCSRP